MTTRFKARKRAARHSVAGPDHDHGAGLTGERDG